MMTSTITESPMQGGGAQLLSKPSCIGDFDFQPAYSRKRSCCLCLAQLGFGYDRITRKLAWRKKSVARTIKSAVRHKVVSLRFVRSRHPTGRPINPPPRKPKVSLRMDPNLKAERSFARMKARNRVKRLRKFVWLWVIKGVKSVVAQNMVGCSRLQFQQHVQSRFSQGMAWNNYATVWELDHIIPCSKFDLSDPKNVRKCFHFSNYQPMLVSDNRSKLNKIIPNQPELTLPFTDRSSPSTTAILHQPRDWNPDRHAAATVQRPAANAEYPQALVCTTSKPSP